MHKMALLLASVFLVTGASAQLDFHSYGMELNSGNLTEVSEIQGDNLLLVKANLSLQNNSVENLSTPQNPQDAATKAYVDSNTGPSTDNQTLTVYNNTDGSNDTVNIENAGNVSIRDDYEAAVQDDQNLSEVLKEGNTAERAIDLNGNQISSISNISFESGIIVGDENTEINQYNDIAIGRGAETQGYTISDLDLGAIAIGEKSFADGNAVALGRKSDAGTAESLAIGPYSEVTGGDGIAIGKSSHSSGTFSVALGEGTNASGKQAIVIGPFASSGYETGERSIVVGSTGSNSVPATASGENAVALGTSANASANGSLALGNQSKSVKPYQATFGNLNGEELDVNVTGNATVHGDLEVKGECSSCLSSSGSTENLSETVAAGNVANQTIEFSEGVSIGNGSTSTGSSSEIALGKGAFANDLSNNYNDSVAIGREANASDGDSVAIGPGSEATGLGTFALGTPAYATGGASISIGDDANSSGPVSIAIGNSPEASSKKSVAIGYFAGFESDEGNKSVTIGNYDLDTGTAPAGIGKESIALGTGARATKDGAVAIGDHAKAQNSYQATFGNLDGEELGVNITGNAAVHGDLDVKSGAVNNAEVLELDTSSLPTCDSSTEGEIRYNGTGHYGCDGSSWSAMY